MSNAEKLKKYILPATAVAFGGTALKWGFGLKKENIGLKVENEELKEKATIDTLTGLKNRRVFDEDIRSTISLINRGDKPAAVLLFDIDHFKSINDGFGHITGDNVLRDVSEVMQRIGRDYDTFYRYGGEEFAAILPNTDMHGAHIMAERLRTAVSENDFGLGRPVTASIGIANLVDEWSVDQADQALYESKEKGRDQVTIFSAAA